FRSPLKNPEGINFVIVRENLEDLYLVLLCQSWSLREQYQSMSSNSINSRMASQRSHSLTRRWTSGRGTRRRSGRGGKSGPRPSAHFSLLALPSFQPDQKTVAQHHRDSVSMKAIPAPPLILIPAQFRFRFFMILLHPVSTMRILDHH